MSYEINGVKYNENNIKNQQIKAKFVSREVICCMTSEVEYIIKQTTIYGDEDAPFTEDDIENYYVKECSECGNEDDFEEYDNATMLKDEDIKTSFRYATDDPEDDTEIITYLCPVCGEEFDTIQEAKECCDEIVYKCNNCGEILNENEYNQLDTNLQEVYEWWAVSEYLGEKLKDFGETVIDGYGNGKWYWGRCATGQAISLDGVISKICKQQEILEGQKYEWSEI